MFHGVTLIALVAFLLNLPFGYMREGSRKFSLRWFLYIHLPIPFIILMRIRAGLGLEAIPFLFFSSFLGQFLGGRAFKSSRNGHNSRNDILLSS